MTDLGVYDDVRVRTSNAAIALSAPLRRCAPVAALRICTENVSLITGRSRNKIKSHKHRHRLSRDNNITLAYYNIANI